MWLFEFLLTARPTVSVYIFKHGGAKPPPKDLSKSDNFDFKITLLALTLSHPNLAWKYETSGQSKWLIGWHQMSNYDVTFADQNRAESPLLLKLHITHLHCRKLIRKKKILKKKFLTAKKPGKQFRDVKMSRDQFFGYFKLVFLSQKTKILNNTILVNYERFVSPKNQLILQKNVKRKSTVQGGGGAIKFLWSPITRVLRVVARNGFRCFTPLLKLFQMMLVWLWG